MKLAKPISDLGQPPVSPTVEQALQHAIVHHQARQFQEPDKLLPVTPLQAKSGGAYLAHLPMGALILPIVKNG